MTKKETLKFRNTLESNIFELTRAARSRDAIRIEDRADSLDRTLESAQRDLAVTTLEAASIRLRETRAALRRIDEGTFGLCVECEEPIRPNRLAAVPFAALCIDCQETADRQRDSRRAPVSFLMAA